jgi:hypothetical protein
MKLTYAILPTSRLSLACYVWPMPRKPLPLIQVKPATEVIQ